MWNCQEVGTLAYHLFQEGAWRLSDRCWRRIPSIACFFRSDVSIIKSVWQVIVIKKFSGIFDFFDDLLSQSIDEVDQFPLNLTHRSDHLQPLHLCLICGLVTYMWRHQPDRKTLRERNKIWHEGTCEGKKGKIPKCKYPAAEGKNGNIFFGGGKYPRDTKIVANSF